VSTLGGGFVTAEHDSGPSTLEVDLHFSGLTSNVTGAQIRCCSALDTTGGVAIDLADFGFPIGAPSGTFHAIIPLYEESSYEPAFWQASGGTGVLAHNVLVGSMQRLPLPGLGIAYFELQTTMHPGGELRGNIIEAPEPATLVMLLCGAAAVCATRRRR
jgi:hypothetical protein